MQEHATLICPLTAEQLESGAPSALCMVQLFQAGKLIAKGQTVDKRYVFEGLGKGAYEVRGQRIDEAGNPIGAEASETVTVVEGVTCVTVEMV